MPTDPQHIEIIDPGRRQAQDAADVRHRLDTLERTPRVQAGSGPPVNDVRDGTLYVQGGASPKLWVRVDGAWKSTALS